MKRKLALKQERGTLIDSSAAIVAAAEVGDGRAFTDAEKATLQANKDRVAAIDKELAEIEALAEQIRSEPSSAATVPAAVAPVSPEPEAKPRVEVKAPNAVKDPKRGFNDHKEFFGSVMKYGMTGRMDERLKPLAAAGSDEQGVYSDPYGGFLVPHGVAPGILSLAPEDDPLAGLVTRVTMSAPSISYNARVDKNHSTSVSGGLTVTRRPETVAGTSSRMAFEQVTLKGADQRRGLRTGPGLPAGGLQDRGGQGDRPASRDHPEDQHRQDGGSVLAVRPGGLDRQPQHPGPAQGPGAGGRHGRQRGPLLRELAGRQRRHPGRSSDLLHRVRQDARHRG
jgi:hypothetical protein